MRAGFRLILLLIVSLALRGFGGNVYAMPHAMEAPPAVAECGEHSGHDMMAPTLVQLDQDDPQHDKSCRISCDQVAAAALPVLAPFGTQATPTVLTPTLPALAVGDLPPPDHPPPIL
ncbi:hypothetical protein [Azonexus sp. IMCC34839]|uniref:hypothetical protein n=1 Tax=Azonexus sp. IMCC34839 TaxID=3133695 RepID=UPI00399AE561